MKVNSSYKDKLDLLLMNVTKAILLADTRVELYSTDIPPAGYDPVKLLVVETNVRWNFLANNDRDVKSSANKR
jgi:hypothetical protein